MHRFCVDDGLSLREIRFGYDDEGKAVLRACPGPDHGETVGGKLPTNCEKCLDVAEGQGIDREIARVRYGRGEDAVLLWKEGMDLPAASAAGEEAWGCEAGSAAYWAERSGGGGAS